MVFLEERAVIAGKYRLEKALARGGMGSVWVARHLQLEIDVAVKLMVPEYASSSEARVRFEREARASAQIRSPHVVHMYDYGTTEDGALFLVMELLRGEDLRARLRRLGRLTPADAALIVDPVCKALECAHDAGLVHRDLKPANLFVAQHGRDETVKVLDFGIVKVTGPAVDSSTTKTGALLGSPHYMSPEQVRRSKDVDPRSDLWSLGVIVFQCLTGQQPFAGEDLGDVLVAICTDDIPVPSQLVPELGPEVDGFLARALTRNPDHRFQSAREFAAAFALAVQATERPVESDGRPAEGPRASGLLPSAAAPALPTVGAVTAHGALARSSPDGSTLAPSGSTLGAASSRRRLTGATAALLLGGAVLVGLASATGILRGQGARLPGALALPSSPAAALSVSSPGDTVMPVVGVDAGVSAGVPASASVPRLEPPASALPPSKSALPPGTPRKPPHDPLDYR